MDYTSSKAPAQRRRALHRLIDELPEAELEVVERLLARMEMERLWGELRQSASQDWANGNYERLDEIIGEVRADRRKRAA